MALLKEIENPYRNGSTAEYWNIGELRIMSRECTALVDMHGYKDKEFREDESSTPAFDIPFTIAGDAFRKDLTFADIYQHAKNNIPAFEGAEDDI